MKKTRKAKSSKGVQFMNNPTALVQKLWNYCNILRDDGLSYGDYVEQLTFLLFLKMADEQSRMAAEVERRLSVVEELESVVSANSDRSRDSVLQRVTCFVASPFCRERSLRSLSFRLQMNEHRATTQ